AGEVIAQQRDDQRVRLDRGAVGRIRDVPRSYREASAGIPESKLQGRVLRSDRRQCDLHAAREQLLHQRQRVDLVSNRPVTTENARAPLSQLLPKALSDVAAR